MAAIIQEYSYEDETLHLNDEEALESYRREKTRHPDALVVLDDLRCGHWDVEVYETEKEKEEYLGKRARGILERFANAFKRR
jgi:hypothetical protein